jgi:hypothetical protein
LDAVVRRYGGLIMFNRQELKSFVINGVSFDVVDSGCDLTYGPDDKQINYDDVGNMSFHAEVVLTEEDDDPFYGASPFIRFMASFVFDDMIEYNGFLTEC